MATVLAVLKIIGIVLLCVLGAILLLILLLLLWPFGYRVDARRDETVEGPVYARARVSWLLHFVVVEAVYATALNLRLKVLGIPVYDKLRGERRRASRKTAGKKRVASAASQAETAATEGAGAATGHDTDASLDGAVTDAPQGASTTDATQAAPGAKVRGEKQKYRGGKDRRSAAQTGKESQRRKPPFTEWLETRLEELVDFFVDLPYLTQDMLERALDRISDAADTYNYYERILTSAGAEDVMRFVKKHVLAILRHVAPKRLDASLDYRNEDPESVAKVMEYYALSLPIQNLSRGRLRLTVDASQEEGDVRGKLLIKGRLILGCLAYHGLRLLLNRKLRKFLRLLRREDLRQDAGDAAEQEGKREAA